MSTQQGTTGQLASKEAKEEQSESVDENSNFCFTELPQSVFNSILASREDNEKIIDILAHALSLPSFRFVSRQAITIEYYFRTIRFCLDAQMNVMQIALCYSIAKAVLDDSIKSLLSLNDSWNNMKSKLLKFSRVHQTDVNKFEYTSELSSRNETPRSLPPTPHCHSPSSSEDMVFQVNEENVSPPETFPPELVMKIVDFFAVYFFQHYRLFIYVFTEERQTEVRNQFFVLQTAAQPLSQSLAIPLESAEQFFEEQYQKIIKDEQQYYRDEENEIIESITVLNSLNVEFSEKEILEAQELAQQPETSKQRATKKGKH